jgi:hypothetical protein
MVVLTTKRALRWVRLTAVASVLASCSSSGSSGSEAIRRGVGAACSNNADCTEPGQTCLSFKGGYCGIAGCANDAGACPQGSACVLHTDGQTYCFLICVDKPECNLNRLPEVEANCSSSVTFVEPVNAKACVPPSG